MTKLTENERQCMTAWLGTEYGWDYMPYWSIHERSQMTKRLVRRTTRQLARKGMVELSIVFDEDGKVRGSGYGTTPKGRTYLETIAKDGAA